ncbi:MAG TPA: hypothetical protein VKY85_02440 [Candidatus Angelobacter sp.]|nr:hypothetical protein [Candidatus Angelobacter sp.]
MKPIRMIAHFSIFSLLMLGLAMPGRAQSPADLGNNAALQYLSAFLQLEDANLQDADVKELSGIIAGTAPYDEGKFGQLVEKNTLAIETMIVGTRYESCDWGLAQRGLGPETPVTYFWRSRALGRLDLLYVLRALSKGEQDQAVRALAAGMRFARHVPSGGPLVPALIAKSLLQQQLSIANRLLDSGKLTASQKDTLKSAVAMLGNEGVDWGAAVHIEMRGLKVGLDEVRAARDQRQYVKEMTGEEAPTNFHGVSPEDYSSLERIAAAYAGALKDGNAVPVHHAIENATALVRIEIPNVDRVLAARQDLRQALEEMRKRLER